MNAEIGALLAFEIVYVQGIMDSVESVGTPGISRLACRKRRAFYASRVAAASVAVLVGLAVGATTGCSASAPSKTPANYTADARRAYEHAMAELNAEHWMEAQGLFREVKRKYSYSKYARLAELRIADADISQQKYAEGIRGYRQFVHDHRSDAEEVAYARSKIAEAQYAQISDSFLLPSSDERDQAVVLDSLRELRSYVHDYPDAKQSASIRTLLADVTARVMRHELYVARYYLQREKFEAAVLRIQYALRTFGEKGEVARTPAEGQSGLEPEALLLLGEVYLKLHQFKDARETFEYLQTRFPSSPLIEPARNFLDYMNQRGV